MAQRMSKTILSRLKALLDAILITCGDFLLERLRDGMVFRFSQRFFGQEDWILLKVR